MNRLITLAAALATSTMLLGAAAGHAASGTASYYTATPAAQTGKSTFLTHATVWSFQNGAFVANRAPERDTVLCQLVAKNVGQLSGFSAGGQPYDADALAKCNAKVK